MCEYLIKLTPGLKIEIKFSKFDLEYSTDCQRDYFAVIYVFFLLTIWFE